jgi:hypothetical protein
MVMAMMGPTSSRAPRSAASTGGLPLADVAVDVLDTTMASSTTRPTDSTMASRREQVQEKPSTCIRKMAPTSDTGMATTGTTTSRHRAQEQEDDDDDDADGLEQRLAHLVDGVVDVLGGVEGDEPGQAGGQLGLDLVQLGADPGDHVQGVGVGSTHTPMKTARLPDMRTSCS